MKTLSAPNRPITSRAMLRAAAILALAIQGHSASGAPKNIIISLDGATPRLVEQYLSNGVLPSDKGLGLIRNRGVRAAQNITASPSLTAVGHIAIATGSSAARNDVVANSYHLLASPFNFNVSGFGAPIGGYCLDCGPNGGPGMSVNPTAEPIWISLRAAGKSVVTATWPGGDGVDVRVPGAANNAIVQPAVERTVDFTVPFGAFAGIGAKGFVLGSADFSPAPASTLNQLAAAGRGSFSPVLEKSTELESFTVGGVAFQIRVAALDTTDDQTANYDSLVFFDARNGIQTGPFQLPSTGPAYVKFSDHHSKPFYLEGSSSKAGVGFYVSALAPDLSTVRITRYGANSIPRNAAVLADVDEVNSRVGFWAPQADFRIPERLSPGFDLFPDTELEEIYEDQVHTFVEYQTEVALLALAKVPNADLQMFYFEQPDGSEHQFLLTDPRQPTDFKNPNSIFAGQDAAKVARYKRYVEFAYQTANTAVQRIIDAVGVDAAGVPNSNILVVSDHGFETFHTAVAMNNLLTSQGIPSSKVRAVTSGPAVNLYINLQGREPNGTVSRGEYLALQNQLLRILHAFADTNKTYTLGKPRVPVFHKIYSRPQPANTSDPLFGRRTSQNIGQDSGDVFALLTPGYNFDGTQSPVVLRQGDPSATTPILSLPNFYGAHGYDPELKNLSAIFYAAGPDIGQGALKTIRNIDIAPTVSAILGVPSAETVEGNVLPIGK